MLFLILAIAVATPASQATPFEEWLDGVRADARAAGISEATIDGALGDIDAPIARVIELDRSQPESRLDFWTYLDRVASTDRIERGRRLVEENRELLDGIRARHGIAPEMLVAVWAIESDFGRVQGGFPVIQSLATLAYDERRSAMFRRELLDALRIVDDGHISADAMQGSWAGAMGQVQFMPSTFVAYARDGDGDGRRDIWGSTADALESAANYMATAWQPGYIWGRQVQLPEGFDRAQAGTDTAMPLETWQRLGVRRVDGSPLPEADIEGSIILPSGGSAPAFLVYQNYRAILRWNRSHFFAITVGHLADRIAGAGPLAR